jgi:hypothetical protein
LRKVLTTCAGRWYNGVSRRDTPTPPSPPRGGSKKRANAIVLL